MYEKQLLEIINCVLNNKRCLCQINQPDWKNIFELAQRHQIENMLFYGVNLIPEQYQPIGDMYSKIKKALMRATAKNDFQLQAVAEMQNLFEKREIYSIALKGINTKKRYPEDSMRSMGDLDILCKSSQQSLIKKTMKELGYNDFQEGRKHDHYARAPFVGVEMHRELLATDSDYSSYYKDIWDRCKPKDGFTFTYEMSLEDEFIYNIIHLVEHFKEGGIGIRFIVDIYVYNHLENLNFTYLKEELEKLHLVDFYDRISLLAEKWFGQESVYADEVLFHLEEYIIRCGVYGNQKNADAIAVSKNGRTAFLLKACFPNLENMISLYPWLERYPFLLPYCWLHRAIRSVFNRRDNVKSQFRAFKNGNENYGNELRMFYKECGL